MIEEGDSLVGLARELGKGDPEEVSDAPWEDAEGCTRVEKRLRRDRPASAPRQFDVNRRPKDLDARLEGLRLAPGEGVDATRGYPTPMM